MNILITGGRAPAALELARVFHAAGHRVSMAESATAHLSQPSRCIAANFRVPRPRQQTIPYIDAMEQIIVQQQIDLLVPTCEEVFYIAMGRERLARHCAVFVEPLERLQPLHHKWMFACRAGQMGLSVPETTLLESHAELRRAFDHWEALVLKPTYSRFASRAILRPLSYESVAHLHITPDIPWVAQQFVEGRQMCSYSVVHGGRISAHTIYPAEFTAGQGAAVSFRHLEHPAVDDWVQRFVRAEHFTGQIAFDFIETPSGEIFALECNPRTTSGAHLLASHPDFHAAFIDTLSTPVRPKPDTSAMLLTGMLVYGLPSAVREGRLRSWLSAVHRSRDVVFSARDPLPALFQLRSIAHFVELGVRHQISPLEASTLDIEWNGDVTALPLY